jgi:hypothetical protein
MKDSTAGFSKTQVLPTLQVMSVQALSDFCGDRIINCGVWPACSPDLNLCDFFPFRLLEGKLDNSNPQTKKLKRKYS